MALVMKMDLPKFKQALTPELVATLEGLVALDVAVELGFYSISLSKAGEHIQCNLPISTASLVKGTAAGPAKTAALQQLGSLLNDACIKWNGGKGFAADDFVDTTLQSIAQTAYDPAAPGSDQTVEAAVKPKATKKTKLSDLPLHDPQGEVPIPNKKTFNPKTQASDGSVKLRFATALGEGVRGTSQGSLYRVVALSERVKVAARIQEPAQVSLRIEGTPNSFEQGKLASLGFGKSTEGHWSIHMDCTGIPPARVIGAVLMDMGIQFDEQAKNLKEAQL